MMTEDAPYITLVPGQSGTWCAVVMTYSEREGGYVMDRSRQSRYMSKVEAESTANKMAFNENLGVR